MPFDIKAIVLLPDHWHLLMQLPQDDKGFSIRLKRIKEEFTRTWLSSGLPELAVTSSQGNRGERGVWQPRFWEHLIQDEEDLEAHVDYIHWNPRKHQLVSRVQDWPFSSFHRFVSLGYYNIDWGGVAPKTIYQDRDWGE